MRRRVLRILAAFVPALTFARVGLAQSYGDQDQVLAIPALDFEDQAAVDGTVIGADGYLYNETESLRDLLAPFTLPSGAEIELMCLDSFAPTSSLWVTAELEEIKLVAGGQAPWVTSIPNAGVPSVPQTGYGSRCSDPISYTVRTSTDVNYDGVIDTVTYAAHVQFFTGSAVGAIRVWWKRQISPAPQSATFGDVPTSDGAFSHVEALAASGITSGCGGGAFCPNATLTRRQMAVFLAKALGLHGDP